MNKYCETKLIFKTDICFETEGVQFKSFKEGSGDID